MLSLFIFDVYKISKLFSKGKKIKFYFVFLGKFFSKVSSSRIEKAISLVSNYSNSDTTSFYSKQKQPYGCVTSIL